MLHSFLEAGNGGYRSHDIVGYGGIQMGRNVNLFAHLLTTLPLDAPEQVANVLTRLSSFVPLPQPCYFGDEVPPRVIWDLESISAVAKQIVGPSKDSYHWQRAAEQESGRIDTGLPFLHGTILIRAAASPALVASYVRFIRNEAVALNADLAFIHISHEDRPLRQDEPEYAMRHAQSTVLLRRGLPDFPWAVVFGKPYVEMFGRQKLLSTPAAQVSEIDGGSIYVQLTDTFESVASADFERIRNAAKIHVGADAFENPNKVRVPTFQLQPPPGPRPLGMVNGYPVTGIIAGRPIVLTEKGPRILDVPFDPGGDIAIAGRIKVGYG